jgi:type I restriction enzyme M protein
LKSTKKDKARSPASKIGANLGFEQTLWQAADKLRGNMDAADYKHVVLGLIFLKYISDAFQEHFEKLRKEPHADPEDRDEYTAENVFWVPKAARWLPLIILRRPLLQSHA